MINRFAHGPVFGGDHHLALHQPPGGPFGITQRLLHGKPVCIFQRIKDDTLLRRIHIFEDINNIVGIQFPHRLRQFRWRQSCNHFVANGLIKF